MADSIRKFSNRPIPFESNQTADSNSNRISKLRRSLIKIEGNDLVQMQPNNDYSEFWSLTANVTVSRPMTMLD